MAIPKPFQWPTPWLWGALILMVVVESSGFFDAVVSACGITIVASVIHYFRERRGAGPAEPQQGALAARLSQIERRLTDTQDVMIALSEKVDRWDEEREHAEAAQ